MKKVLFRNSTYYGAKEHTPAEILAYETINLGNTFLLEMFIGELEGHLDKETMNDAKWLLSALEAGIVLHDDEDIDYSPYLPVFKGIVKGLEKLYNISIKHLLWLGELEDVLDRYCYGYDNYLGVIDAYEADEEGLIIYIPCDGGLYAFSEKPKALSKTVVKEALDDSKLHKVWVWPGFGYELQTLYFDHDKIGLAEIANQCIEQGFGSWLSLDEYEEIFGDGEHESYAFVDLSEYNHDNVMFCIENIKCDESAEIC